MQSAQLTICMALVYCFCSTYTWARLIHTAGTSAVASRAYGRGGAKGGAGGGAGGGAEGGAGVGQGVG